MSLPNIATTAGAGSDRALEPRPDRRGQTIPPAIVLRVASAAVVIGLACGALSRVMESLVDSMIWYYAWHGVVPWGGVTLGIGFAVGRPVGLAAAAGLATQIGLVLGYYFATYVHLGETEWWVVAAYAAVGLVMGPLYGMAGALLTAPATRCRPIVVGVISAALLMDGFNQMWEADESRRHVAVVVAVGAPYLVVAILVLGWLSSSWRDRIGAVGISAALTAVFLASLGVY